MATKQLVRKKDAFISVDKELYPFLNKVISKNKEVTDIREEVIRRIASELDKAQGKAKARLLGLNYCINTFDAYYKENPLFGGLCLTSGGVPYAYKYRASTTLLDIIWLGNKAYVNAIRSTVYPGGNVKPIYVYDHRTVFEKLDEKLLLDKAYREYFKTLGIDIDKEKSILHVVKHKQENIFIILLLGKESSEVALFNGKETLTITTRKNTWLHLDNKFTLEKFFFNIVVYTKVGNNYNLVHDFLNQKIGAEHVQMFFYV